MVFKTFEDIEAWQEARELVRQIYSVSGLAPFSGDFALRDQIRRAALSTLSNIAEGFERDGNAEFVHFLSMAKGSSGELRAQLYVALDLRYIDRTAFDELYARARKVSSLVHGLIKYLKKSGLRGRKYNGGNS
jgi:four helix bundle protein